MTLDGALAVARDVARKLDAPMTVVQEPGSAGYQVYQRPADAPAGSRPVATVAPTD